MCSIYKSLGASALITSAAVRDLAQIHSLQFAVFAGSTICSHAYCHAVNAGRPVRVGGLNVSTGDLLHADANGVTNIPLDIAADVADVASEFVKCESHVIEYTRSDGVKSAAELRLRRQAMADGIAELRRRVSRRSPSGA
jgi:regulator of RNase E activity RraA